MARTSRLAVLFVGLHFDVVLLHAGDLKAANVLLKSTIYSSFGHVSSSTQQMCCTVVGLAACSYRATVLCKKCVACMPCMSMQSLINTFSPYPSVTVNLVTTY
jgi:predicted aldo/keto reductase-like oxidoreductase